MKARLSRLIVGAFCTMGASLLFLGLPAGALAAAPQTEEASVLDVSATSATFQAKINPQGLDTKYRFEYDTRAYSGSETHGQSIPQPEGGVGNGTVGVVVESNPQDLTAGTVYHFRVVAQSSGGTTYGTDTSLRTQPAGTKLTLPDGREWEQVSPANKYGAGIEPLSFWPVQASADGDALTYDTDAPVTAKPSSSMLLESQVLSQRSASGWSNQDISTPTEVVVSNTRAQYRLFNPDLSLAVVEPASATPLVTGVSGRTAYLRSNSTGGYQPLGESAEMVTSSPDLSHILFRDTSGLAESSGGQTQTVSSCPEGLYVNYAPAWHRLSDDGTRLVCGGGGGQLLYLNDVPSGESIQIDAVHGGSGAEETSALYVGSNSSDSRVFFTDGQHLTADSGPSSFGAPDLYEFKVTSASGEKLVGELTNLTVSLNNEEAADVRGTLGISEDGSHLYFVADGQLAAGATPGVPNLYLLHEGTVTFISSVSGEDLGHYSPLSLGSLTASVSRNGRFLAFMSQASLTGYDNRDVNSGEPDEEVYLYDSSTSHLICASCNPTGARPLGVRLTENIREGTSALVDRPEIWSDDWLAALVPGWTQGAMYQTRYLAENGRLFFDSSDALVPQDTNGKMDVYEFEPDGVGSCVPASATFDEKADGCVGLISSGTSGEESEFVEASEGGDDVFFLTASKLVPEDLDNGLDIYTAHVCSEAEPCTPTAVTPPACVTADSCRAALSPQPTIFGASGSATFSGAGNLIPEAPVTPTGPKPLTKQQKLAKALRACHAKKKRAKRIRCEAQARKRYGSPSKAKNTTRRGK